MRVATTVPSWGRIWLIWFGVSSAAVSTIAHADVADPLGELRACARVVSDVIRVQCYEDLGRRVLQDEQSAAAAPTASEPPAAPPGNPIAPSDTPNTTLTDDIGGSKFAKNANSDEQAITAVVTSCKKDVYGKYLFYFQNGQVWKQRGGKNFRKRNCQFDVTISKDFAGFRMEIAGETGWVRITRIK